MDSLKELMSTLVSTVLIPIILVLGSALLVVIKSYADKITKSVIAKNESVQLESSSATKNNLVEGVDKVVLAAVEANMQLAEKYKENSGSNTLTPEQAKELHASAKNLIYSSLPINLVQEDNPLLKIIGGKQVLDNLIENMIEKHVANWNYEE